VLPEKEGVIAVQTRSAFQIMTQLDANVEVPAEHIAELRTYPPIPGLVVSREHANLPLQSG
jgi:hypothetical protein